MKKLRLLLFEDCKKNCNGCCNKDWDLKSLEYETEFYKYDLIMLTGGEPMLKPIVVYQAICDIRKQTPATIYLYTAFLAFPEVEIILRHIDGITVTLHDQVDAMAFAMAQNRLEKGNKSLRLNVFEGVNYIKDSVSKWEVKDNIKWIKNCPLPKNEVFKRYQWR